MQKYWFMIKTNNGQKMIVTAVSVNCILTYYLSSLFLSLLFVHAILSVALSCLLLHIIIFNSLIFHPPPPLHIVSRLQRL